MEIILKIVGVLFMAFLAVVTAGMILVLVAEGYMTIRYSIGKVSQDSNITFIKELVRGEDGCVNYIDIWGDKGKICGSYAVEIFGQK